MIKKLISSLYQHFSLLIIIVGAGCFLGSNIFLKEILSNKDYGIYSLFITYISFIYLWGLFGLEQSFIRFSTPSGGNTINIQKFQVQLILGTILLTSVLATALLYNSVPPDLKVSVLLYLTSLSTISLLFLFNIFRLNSDFVFAQILSNLWKIAFFVLVIYVLCSGGNISLEALLNCLMYIIISTFFLGMIFFFKRIKFVYSSLLSKKNIVIAGFQFFISITLFSILLFADRIIIEYKYSIEEFGNYFYLTNFFVAPFSLLHSYIGFKQVVFYKGSFNIAEFKNYNKKVLLFAIGLSVVLLLLPKMLSACDILDVYLYDDIIIILLLLVLGTVRLYSSSITAAFEARISVLNLRKANLIILVISGLVILSVLLYVNSIELIIASIILIWIIRNFIFSLLLFQQLDNEQNGN